MDEHKGHDGKGHDGKRSGDKESDDRAKQKAPPNVVNGTRVTVAFPFSKIALQEPTDDLRALADLVAELAGALADIDERDITIDLRSRAAALRDQLNASVSVSR